MSDSQIWGEDSNGPGNGFYADLIQPAPVRVMVLSKKPLNSELGDYIALLPNAHSELVGDDGVGIQGIHGTLLDQIHYSALCVDVERAGALHGGVWVVLVTDKPDANTPFEIGDWLESDNEEQEQSLLTLTAPSEPSSSFHMGQASVVYRSQWPIDFFDSLFEGMDPEEQVVPEDHIDSEIDELKDSVENW